MIKVKIKIENEDELVTENILNLEKAPPDSSVDGRTRFDDYLCKRLLKEVK